MFSADAHEQQNLKALIRRNALRTATDQGLLPFSCPSANKFLAILFLLFARSSSNSLRSVQRFRRTLRRNFNWIRQQMNNFPIDPRCKYCPLSATL